MKLAIPILIDLDGVLRVKNKPVPKLKEFFYSIEKNGWPACVLSNSTLLTAEDVNEYFLSHSIECKIPIMTASTAAAKYAEQNYKRVSVFCADNVKKIFSDLLDDDNPEAIIIGDYGKLWNYEIMNDIFKKLLSGAELIAMHKNRYWESSDEGLTLDAGPFIQALEYASGKNAVLIGKPSHLYFKSVLGLLNAPEDSRFVMIGDSLENDIAPVKQLGGITIHVKSAISENSSDLSNEIIPDYTANNLDEVLEIITNRIQL